MLLKIAININKRKKKASIGAGMAAKEKDFMKNQLVLLEAKCANAKRKCERFTREMDDIKNTFRCTNMIYKEKTKHAMSEYHSRAFGAKTEQLELYAVNHKNYCEEERKKLEHLAGAEEKSNYNIQLLQRLATDIQLKSVEKCQAAKEDYVMVLQAQTDAYEAFLMDIQDDVEDAVKDAYMNTDANRYVTFDIMLQNQERAINEMRKYFQGVNMANSGVIYHLKNTMNSRRAKLDRVEKDVFHKLEEYARFVSPIEGATREISGLEEFVKDSTDVEAERSKRWRQQKRLADIVTRLRWKRELEIIRVQKARDQLDEVEKAYAVTVDEAARKAGLALLVHSRCCTLLKEKEVMYEITHSVMHDSVAHSEKNGENKQSIPEIFKKQAAEMEDLRKTGFIIKKKYERVRDHILSEFQKKFLRSLESTGFNFPTLESYFSKTKMEVYEVAPKMHPTEYATMSENTIHCFAG